MLFLKDYRGKDSPARIHQGTRPLLLVAAKTFGRFCFFGEHVFEFRVDYSAYQGARMGINPQGPEAFA